MDYPGPKSATIGTPAAYSFIYGHDPDGDTLSWGVTGLPPGLQMIPYQAPNSQVILGTPTTAGTYNVAITANDGRGGTTSQSFVYTILPYGSQLPSTSMSLSGLTIDSQSLHGTLSGPANATILLTATGPATVPSSVTLDANGQGSYSVSFTALSSSPDDILVTAWQRVTAGFGPPPQPQQDVPAAAQKITNLTITMPQQGAAPINRPNPNPRAANGVVENAQNHDLDFRIPMTVNTKFNFTLSIDLRGTGKSVTLAVQDLGNNKNKDGWAQFDNNQDTLPNIQLSGSFKLHGTQQTSAALNTLQLYVEASVPNDPTIKSRPSNNFSVSTLPMNVVLRQWGRNLQQGMVLVPGIPGVAAGVFAPPYSLHAKHAWSSESNNLADLDKVWLGEYVVDDHGGTYMGAGRPWKNNGPAVIITPDRGKPNGDDGEFWDVFRPALLPNAGPADTIINDQWYGIQDGRTELILPNDKTHAYQNDLAYFQIVCNVYQDGAMRWHYSLSRTNTSSFDVLL